MKKKNKFYLVKKATDILNYSIRVALTHKFARNYVI